MKKCLGKGALVGLVRDPGPNTPPFDPQLSAFTSLSCGAPCGRHRAFWTWRLRPPELGRMRLPEPSRSGAPWEREEEGEAESLLRRHL
jgi:hypothetical protein